MRDIEESSIAQEFRRAAEKQRKKAETKSSEVAARVLLLAKAYDNLAQMLERSVRPPR
jgi:hypothetical protein